MTRANRSHVDPNDNLRKLLDLIDEGHTPTIEFVDEGIGEQNSYDVGHQCKVLSYAEDWSAEEYAIIYILETDFREYEERNKPFSKPVWFDKNDIPRLYWHETQYYPKNKRVELFLQLPSHAESEDPSTGYLFKIVDGTNSCPTPWPYGEPMEHKILLVSTGHIKENDRYMLEYFAGCVIAPLICYTRLSGKTKLIQVSTTEMEDGKPDGISDECWNILVAAHKAGYTRVEFDGDAERYDLPWFDW